MSLTSGKSFEQDSDGVSDPESTPMAGALEGDSVAEAAVRFCFSGGVGDGAAAFAGGLEAVGAAEAEAEAETEAEAEAEAEVKALLAAV
jgi:hypothetical protein